VSTPSEARAWFQTKYPDVPEEDIDRLLDSNKSNGSRTNASYTKVKEIWSSMLIQGGDIINSTKAYEAAAQELGTKYKESSARNQFKKWVQLHHLVSIGKTGKSHNYGKMHPKMKEIKSLVEEHKPVDLSHILKTHKSLVEETRRYLSQNGYRKEKDNIWRYVNE